MWNEENLIRILKKDGIAVMPTDTVYGIVGRAESRIVVDRIYKARKRNPEKPCIILVGNTEELEKFSIRLTLVQKEKLKEYWPGPISVVFECTDENLAYLHRGTKTLAFRLPVFSELRDFLNKTGALIAPSSNIEGEPVASNIEEAKKYFGNSVDFYLDGGKISGKASKVISLSKEGLVTIIRE